MESDAIDPSTAQQAADGADPAQPDAYALPAEFLARRKKDKRKKLIKGGIAAVVVVAAVAGALAWMNMSNQSSTEDLSIGTYTESVTKGDLDLTVEGSGSLTPMATPA